MVEQMTVVVARQGNQFAGFPAGCDLDHIAVTKVGRI